jgi:hypothetical protein
MPIKKYRMTLLTQWKFLLGLFGLNPEFTMIRLTQKEQNFLLKATVVGFGGFFLFIFVLYISGIGK